MVSTTCRYVCQPSTDHTSICQNPDNIQQPTHATNTKTEQLLQMCDLSRFAISWHLFSEYWRSATQWPSTTFTMWPREQLNGFRFPFFVSRSYVCGVNSDRVFFRSLTCFVRGFSMDSHVKDLGKWQHEPKINGGTFEDDIFSANIGDLNYWDAWHVLWFDRRCSDVELT